MKIRDGFVSNSSSSSFVIAFKDKYVADVVRSLFGGTEETKEDIKKGFNREFKFNNIISIQVPYGSEEMFENLKETEDFEFLFGD
uniref:Uncharacterized protein n=1 Tax=viral metagenome TaxID=1070528 RepID=A0A6M3Y0T6_9ZZZZ